MAGRAAARQLLQGEEGGFATLIFIIYPPKQRRFDIVFFKKINLIEPADSEKTDRFVRFTSWIVDSSGPTPIQCYSDPIDQTGPES